MAEQKNVRCAIYTRKSTDEGLDKEFNTLEAQREAGENYVRSQKHQGWVIIWELTIFGLSLLPLLPEFLFMHLRLELFR